MSVTQGYDGQNGQFSLEPGNNNGSGELLLRCVSRVGTVRP
jgi:hypothetical protein